MQTSARFSEDDPQKAGTPVVGNDTVSLGDLRPDPSWEIDRLVIYAKGEMANSVEAKRQAILQARKEAIHLFRAGHALALARAKCKSEQHGDWKKFKTKHGLPNTTANDAIRLYERAKTEDALAGLGITEAKEKLGLAKPKKGKKATDTATPPSAEQGNDDSTDTDEAPTADPGGQEDVTDAGPGDAPDIRRWEREAAKAEAEAAKVEGVGKSEPETPLYKVTVMVFTEADQEAIQQALSDWSPISKIPVGTKQFRSVAVHAQPPAIGALLEKLGQALEQSQPKKVRVSIEL